MNAPFWAAFALLFAAIIVGISGAIYVMRRADSVDRNAVNGAALLIVILIATAVAALIYFFDHPLTVSGFRGGAAAPTAQTESLPCFLLANPG